MGRAHGGGREPAVVFGQSGQDTADGRTLFLANRLHGPLGYVNGEAGYLLLGFWPLVAAAERARRAHWSARFLCG